MKRFLRPFLFTFLGFVLIEALLQLVSLVFVVNWRPDAFRVAARSEIRIVTLGESTTDANFAKSGKSWPEFLEEKLRARGLDVAVVNLGQSGTTTDKMLARLPSDLAEIRPQIVVSMIGINDSDKWVTQVNRSPFGALKLYRMASWFWRETKEFFRSDDLLPKADDELIERIEKEGQAAIATMSSEDQARAYAYLAQKTDVYAKFDGHDLWTGPLYMYRKAFETGHLVEEMINGYGALLSRFKLDGECLKLFERYRSLGGVLVTADHFVAAEHCASDTPEWRRILNRNGDELIYEFLTSESQSPVARVHEAIAASGAHHVVMHYPMRSIEKKKRLIGESSKRVSFVDNVDNFKSALATRSWEEIFVDRFAYDFGHATDFGNQMIADRVLPEVSRVIEAVRSEGSSR